MEPCPLLPMNILGSFMRFLDLSQNHSWPEEQKAASVTHVLIQRLGISWFVLIGQIIIDPTPSRRFSSAGGTNSCLFPLCNDKTCRNIIISKSFDSPLTTCIEICHWVWNLLGGDMKSQTAWLHKPHFLRKLSGNVCVVYIQHNMACVFHTTLKVVVVIICSIVVLQLT